MTETLLGMTYRRTSLIAAQPRAPAVKASEAAVAMAANEIIGRVPLV